MVPFRWDTERNYSLQALWGPAGDNPSIFLWIVKRHCPGVPAHNQNMQRSSVQNYPESNSNHKQMTEEEHRNAIIHVSFPPRIHVQLHYLVLRDFLIQFLPCLETQNWFLFHELGHCPFNVFNILWPEGSQNNHMFFKKIAIAPLLPFHYYHLMAIVSPPLWKRPGTISPHSPSLCHSWFYRPFIHKNAILHSSPKQKYLWHFAASCGQSSLLRSTLMISAPHSAAGHRQVWNICPVLQHKFPEIILCF